MKIKNLNNLIDNHFNETSRAISNNRSFNKKIINLAELIKLTHKKNSKIFVAGNGGSNADAEHFVGEMICTFDDKKRIGLDAETLHNNFSVSKSYSGYDSNGVCGSISNSCDKPLFANISILIDAPMFNTLTQPLRAAEARYCSKVAFKTNATASLIVIKNLVTSLSVTVTGPPLEICFLKSGTTEP